MLRLLTKRVAEIVKGLLVDTYAKSLEYSGNISHASELTFLGKGTMDYLYNTLKDKLETASFHVLVIEEFGRLINEFVEEEIRQSLKSLTIDTYRPLEAVQETLFADDEEIFGVARGQADKLIYTVIGQMFELQALYKRKYYCIGTNNEDVKTGHNAPNFEIAN